MVVVDGGIHMRTTTMMILLTTILVACGANPRVTTTPNEQLVQRRAELLRYLDEYVAAGQYPTDEAGMPQSVFVDARGVRCPMAELIWRSGHPELVQAVAREHNKVRLAEVTEGPLHDWMMGSGLTMDEIALIQGVMDLNTQWIITNEDATILARAQVRGRLETAQRVVQQNRQAKRNGKIPKVTVNGKVIPRAALKSGPQFARHN
jgi:hypothetical protein